MTDRKNYCILFTMVLFLKFVRHATRSILFVVIKPPVKPKQTYFPIVKFLSHWTCESSTIVSKIAHSPANIEILDNVLTWGLAVASSSTKKQGGETNLILPHPLEKSLPTQRNLSHIAYNCQYPITAHYMQMSPHQDVSQSC